MIYVMTQTSQYAHFLHLRYSLIKIFQVLHDAADPTRTISANQARTLIRKLVAGFQNAGLQRGDCVLIHSFNDIYYPILVLGIIAAGGIYSGTNPSYTVSSQNAGKSPPERP
jgi:acyl-CoA synthetase (AMP-forming)/AMP-acid ligase II